MGCRRTRFCFPSTHQSAQGPTGTASEPWPAGCVVDAVVLRNSTQLDTGADPERGMPLHGIPAPQRKGDEYSRPAKSGQPRAPRTTPESAGPGPGVTTRPVVSHPASPTSPKREALRAQLHHWSTANGGVLLSFGRAPLAAFRSDAPSVTGMNRTRHGFTPVAHRGRCSAWLPCGLCRSTTGTTRRSLGRRTIEAQPQHS
jgi:hypothetical protein